MERRELSGKWTENDKRRTVIISSDNKFRRPGPLLRCSFALGHSVI